MKEYSTENLRNIAIVAHGGAGKTVLTEAFLHFTGATTRMNKIEEGNTVSDYDEEEIRRQISIYTSVVPVEYRDTKINFLDTPGFSDFVGEEISALSVSEGALILIDSVAGVEVGTEIAWNYAEEMKLPRFIVINKLDRENANFEKVFASATELAATNERRLIKVQIPVGEKENFKGVIDLIHQKMYSEIGKTASEIPAEYKDAVEEARHELIEAAAEGDDSLLEKYLETGELSGEELMIGLKEVILSGAFLPVFVASGRNIIGVRPLLDAIIEFMPTPAEHPEVVAHGKAGDEVLHESDNGPAVVYVWKTTADPFVGKMTYFKVISGIVTSDVHLWNAKKNTDERMGGLHIQRGKEAIPVKNVHAGDIAVVSKLSVTETGDTLCEKNHQLSIDPPTFPAPLYKIAISPKTQSDAAKISSALTRLCEEDPTLSWAADIVTSQTTLSGMGDQHIDIAIRRAQTKFQVGINKEELRVPYREGITRKASAQYRHKKQSGGSGQFGEVHLRIEPLPEEEFKFSDELVGMNLSRSYLPSIEKGITAIMGRGVFAGYPLSNVHVIVFDGKEHPVDSKPIAFETAGREAFKLAVNDAGPVLFEPIMLLHITVPEANMGDIMGDLNTRRGRVQGSDSEKGKSTIHAHVPMAEVLKYTTELRSMTGGRGVFSMEFDHYDIVPANLAQPIMDAHRKEMESKEE
ncbi:MAG TPA: elongation factor G [Anaerolineales bacterium]|nr:elongation factor G [Anaerolineales bacterium]